MIARPAVAALFARLDRAGADVGALAEVALPDALLALPEQVLAGFADDGWQRVAQAVARSDDAAVVRVVEETPNMRGRPAPRIVRTAARAEPVETVLPRAASASTVAPRVGGSIALAADPELPLAHAAPMSEAPLARSSRAASPEVAAIGTSPAMPSALRWQPASDVGVRHADLANWARMDVATPARPARARDQAPAPSHGGLAQAIRQSVPIAPAANGSPDAALRAPTATASPFASPRSPALNAGSQLSRLVDLWQTRDDTPAATPVSVRTGESAAAIKPPVSSSPSTLPSAPPVAGSQVAVFDAFATDDGTADHNDHLATLLEDVLVRAVERQGLTVENP